MNSCRMVIEYSYRTINRFTQLDVNSLSQIEKNMSELFTFKVFRTIDLKFVYHQILLNLRDHSH